MLHGARRAGGPRESYRMTNHARAVLLLNGLECVRTTGRSLGVGCSNTDLLKQQIEAGRLRRDIFGDLKPSPKRLCSLSNSLISPRRLAFFLSARNHQWTCNGCFVAVSEVRGTSIRNTGIAR